MINIIVFGIIVVILFTIGLFFSDNKGAILMYSVYLIIFTLIVGSEINKYQTKNKIKQILIEKQSIKPEIKDYKVKFYLSDSTDIELWKLVDEK